jgi:GNAT superfamily N-acetyltransferase
MSPRIENGLERQEMDSPGTELVIRPIEHLPAVGLDALVRESEAEGFRFLRRLRDEFDAGTNRFDGAGEVLLGAWMGDALVAVGGINVDPYAGDARVGRLRHLYVGAAHRRSGVGREMVAALVRAAAAHFDALHLRTDTDAAARFYERLGFAPVPGHPSATHRLALRGRSLDAL